MLFIGTALAGLLAIATPHAALAAEPAAPASAAQPAQPLQAELVKTGLYLISGGGGNSLLRFSANGLLLVDGKLPGNYRALMSQVRKINKLSDMPVRALVLSDHHPNHAGNSAQFMAARVPIVAQERIASQLSAGEPADGKPALPLVTYQSEYTIRMGGVETQLKHFGPAHTGGDTVVYFPDLKVVAVGDLFSPGTPELDYASGGSLLGWGPVLAQVLRLDFEQVVPSSGPIVGRRELEAFKSRIDTLSTRARALVNSGVAKSELMAQLKTDDLGWRFELSAEALDGFYAELSR